MDAELNDKLPDHIAEALRALDRDATQSAEQVDAGRVAARVLQRLKDEPVRVLRPRPLSVIGLRIAAAIAILVIGGAVTQRLLMHRAPAGVQALPVLPAAPGSTVVDVSTQEAMLNAVDDARSAAADTAGAPANVTVDDLNEQELQALLTTMDDQGGGTE